MAHKDFMEERRAKILEYLKKNGRAEIAELAKLADSTEITIRRDLTFLEDQGLIIKTHGGAIKKEVNSTIWQTTTVNSRLCQNVENKRKIAAEVANLISDGESLMIDGGSTTQMVAEALCERKNLLVVTNSPDIGKILVGVEENKVIITGGELNNGTYSSLGSDAVAVISKYYVDKAILGLTGLIPSVGCFAAIPMETDIKKEMTLHARETIIVIDSSKIGVGAFCKAFDLTSINTLVTDKDISEADSEKIRSFGIHLITV